MRHLMPLLLTGTLLACTSTAKQPAGPEGSWHIRHWQGQVALPATAELVLSDGQLRLYFGCNRLSSRFQTQATHLRLAPLVATKMACEPDLMAAEQQAGVLLAATTAYRRHGERLQLLDPQHQVLIEARQQR